MEGVAVALSNEVGTELKPAAETADSWAAASVAATELEAVEDEAFNTSAGADSLRMDDWKRKVSTIYLIEHIRNYFLPAAERLGHVLV